MKIEIVIKENGKPMYSEFVNVSESAAHREGGYANAALLKADRLSDVNVVGVLMKGRWLY